MKGLQTLREFLRTQDRTKILRWGLLGMSVICATLMTLFWTGAEKAQGAPTLSTGLLLPPNIQLVALDLKNQEQVLSIVGEISILDLYMSQESQYDSIQAQYRPIRMRKLVSKAVVQTLNGQVMWLASPEAPIHQIIGSGGLIGIVRKTNVEFKNPQNFQHIISSATVLKAQIADKILKAQDRYIESEVRIENP